MPEDIPKAVMMLIWLLSGTIIFGWLVMDSTVLNSIIFAIIFFGLPVVVYKKIIKSRPDNDE